MRISLNGRDAAIPPVLVGTVGDAYESSVNHATRLGLTVLDLTLDGRPVPAIDRPRFFERPVADFSDMDLETVDTRQLVRAAVAEARKHLGPCREALQAAHGLLSAGQYVRALRTLKPALEVWMSVCEAVTKAAILISFDVAHPLDEAGSIEDAQHRIVSILERTRLVFETRDWPALSALIESDFLPLVARWESICRVLEAESPSSPSA